MGREYSTPSFYVTLGKLQDNHGQGGGPKKPPSFRLGRPRALPTGGTADQLAQGPFTSQPIPDILVSSVRDGKLNFLTNPLPVPRQLNKLPFFWVSFPSGDGIRLLTGYTNIVGSSPT